MKTFRKILVANRGEIALRVMRTIRRMGMQCVAVYSEADRNAPHVRYADEAVHIGNAPSSESYLVIDRIIQAALDTGAEAIHPGYGFLSENSKFAAAVKAAKLTFIGPSERAIEVMGSKLAAKEAVKPYGVPMVPGVDHAVETYQEAADIADQVGYPVLIKASAGGGGKGMRVVNRPEDLKESMERAVSEAISAFGDGAVFVEKYVTEPRHIEIQVLADEHGKTLHLFERECSIQRRHQKVVEEAPSVLLTPEVRDAMGKAAVRVAEACAYVGAGTVEFLVDANLDFYFLEMNTRLQVEHPVTELITGLDLVEWQIKVAQGQPLPFSQEDLQIQGHAIELRVYAEDPYNNFLPNIGDLEAYEEPTGPSVRVDSGYEAGMTIPIYYDPMLSKLITYADTRAEAIQHMLRAIDDYHIEGIQTTLPFGKFVMEHEAFRSGKFDTGFVKQYFTPEAIDAKADEEAEVAARFATYLLGQQRGKLATAQLDRDSHWWESRK